MEIFEIDDFIQDNLEKVEADFCLAQENNLPEVMLLKCEGLYHIWLDLRRIFDEYAASLSEHKTEDRVNNPSHYNTGKFEVIDIIKDQLSEVEFRGYIKGNVIKYVTRESHKNGDEDLLKCIFYLNYLMHGTKTDGSTPLEID